MPGPAKPWQPGQSGNPAGRPKGKYTAEIAKAAREYGPEAIERLVYWMRSDEFKASVPAAQALLDRGYGKPPQEITGLDGDALLPQFSIDGLSDDEALTFLRLVRRARTGLAEPDDAGGAGGSGVVGPGEAESDEGAGQPH